MIEVQGISKRYSRKGDAALSDVSLSFDDTGLVAICGPRGSGKSTLLNILAGVERPDSGSLVVDGKPMGKRTEGAWNKYRNSRAAVAFQDPVLVDGRNVLENVELALSVSGIGGKTRRARAEEALGLLGIRDCAKKVPADLSGTERRLVGIARALAKEPDVLVADDPTAGLDDEAAKAVMKALSDVSKDHLVVMATSDEEWAVFFATRTIHLDKGKVVSDESAVPGASPEVARHAGGTAVLPGSRRKGRRSMPFFAAAGYSLRNMSQKKGRAILATFASALSMMGIAAIIALGVGANNYINAMEEASIATDPIVVGKSGLDLTGLLSSEKVKDMSAQASAEENTAAPTDAAKINTVEGSIEQVSEALQEVNSHVRDNDLAGFKQYVDSNSDGILDQIETVQYDFGTAPLIYNSDTSHGVETLNPSTLSSLFTRRANSTTSTLNSLGSFNEMLDNTRLLDQQMEVVSGRWPSNFDECVVALDANGSMSDLTLYNLGLYDHEAVDKALNAAMSGEDVQFPEAPSQLSYEQLMNTTFTVLPKTSLYQKNDQRGTWADKSLDEEYVKNKLAQDGITLKVVGIVKPRPEGSALITEGVGYTHDLTKHLIDIASQSEIVKQQLSKPEVDVFTGKTFTDLRENPSGNLDFDNIVTINQSALDHLLGMFTFDLEDEGEQAAEEPEEAWPEEPEEAEQPEAEDAQMKEIWDVIEEIDWSQFEINTRDVLDAVNAQRIFDAIALASMLDPEESGLQLSEEQQAEVSALTGEMVADFTMYAIQQGASVDDLQDAKTVAKYWKRYQRSDTGKKKMAAVDLLVGKEYGSVVEGKVEEYLFNVYTEVIIDEVSAEIIEQALDEVEKQLAAEVERQLPIVAKELDEELEKAVSEELERVFKELDEELNVAGQELDVFLDEAGRELETTLDEAGREIEKGVTDVANNVSNDLSNLIQINLNEEDLVAYMNNLIDGSEIGYDNNMAKLGYADVNNPLSMSIYPKNLDAKHKVVDIISGYNVKMEDSGQHDRTIIYNNSAGDTTDMLDAIVGVVGVALIALMAVAMVVGCVMMVIIIYTGISARRREMGLLRALGASRGNLLVMCGTETFVEGLLAGGIAVGVVYLISVLVNTSAKATGGADIMSLPPLAALGIVAISCLVPLIAGLIPSLVMSFKDPAKSLKKG